MQKQIPHNWQRDKLGNLTEKIFSGGTPDTRKPEYWDGDLKWLSSGETGNKFIYDTKQKITNEGVKNSSTSLAQNSDVVIASAGQGNTRGQVSFLKTDTYINQSIIDIRTNKKVLNNLWLFYNLSNRYSELRSISDSTSIRGSLTTKIFKDLSIVFPKNINEQLRVANILYSFDQKIELNNKIAKTLEEMAQEIFKEWFVNFHFPGHEKTEFVDSEFGKIPKTWAVGTLERLVDIRNGYAFKSGDYKTKGIPIIRTMDFDKNGSVVLGNQIYLSEETAEKYNNFLLNKFDFLLVMVGASLGKWAIVPSNILPGLQNQNMWNFRPKEVIFTFFNIQFLKKLVWKQRKSATGSARDFFRKDYFYSIKALIPDDKALVSFNKIVEPIYEKLDLILGENKKLSTLRDSLLPKLMKGEIKV